MYIARMMQRGDEGQVVALAGWMHESSRFASMPFVPERVAKLCEAALTLPQYGCAVLEQEDGALVGFVAMVVEPYVNCDLLIARDLSMYIEPPSRSYPTFLMLMRCIEEWCRGKNVWGIDFSVSAPPTDQQAQRYGKLWERIGYRWNGSNYMKELG